MKIMYKTLAYIIGFNDVMNKLSIKLYHQMQTFVLEGVSINTLASILTYESSPFPCLPSTKYQWHDKGQLLNYSGQTVQDSHLIPY